LKPESGNIIINNSIDLKDIDLKAWRSKIVYSDHNNLIKESLSTGQKQLLDLKESFSLKNNKKKEIFIFDEADNSLDEKHKKSFNEKLNEMSKKKIVIVISH
jgi:ABC-type bacteriocin/lantibiotic exporter with double-glycine peptidase domain